MYTVYSSQDQLLISHLKNLLDQHGIVSVLEQMHLQGAMGELPMTAWPRIRVPDREQAKKARSLIKNALQPGPKLHEVWICSSCGETIEGQFTQCWQCGAHRKHPE
ncbi:MAG: hypothetical protein CR997_09155 [Acidobacteria bacterium]|nr:MAG: hypothetical protein CR997_09155 [Acidobacteriota bacterium]